MSRTYRDYPVYDRKKKIITIERLSERKRDDTQVMFFRDANATGLRDHKLHRFQARQMLKAGRWDEIRMGKKRKYGNFYGIYEI